MIRNFFLWIMVQLFVGCGDNCDYKNMGGMYTSDAVENGVLYLNEEGGGWFVDKSVLFSWSVDLESGQLVMCGDEHFFPLMEDYYSESDDSGGAWRGGGCFNMAIVCQGGDVVGLETAEQKTSLKRTD